jgi:hypothetical protein
MAMRDVGMVSRRFLVATCLVLGCFFVMAGCMFMVLRRFRVVFCTFFTHKEGIEDIWICEYLVRLTSLNLTIAATGKRSKLQFRDSW